MNSAAKKTVVLDFDTERLFQNKVFIEEEALKVSHTILPICYLAEKAEERGISFVTPDVFLNQDASNSKVLLMSHLQTRYTQKLIAQGARPAILTCQESPFVATRFYFNLPEISYFYPHSFLFSGMAKRASKNTIYHQMFFPQSYDFSDVPVVPFYEKKFLTMISGNKRMGSLKKTLILKLLYGFGVKEIYAQRQKVINFMANHPKDFDLYGFGWEKGGKNEEERQNIQKVYRGSVTDKVSTLRQYKFAFCFENSMFPGYVTEKIFDVMYAGCVPVYNGAPDIASFVPENAFIDVRDFKDYEALFNFLKSIDQRTYQKYLQNIQSFLSSQAFAKFSQENFANNVLQILEEEFAHA